jgi:malto-oligosyltrehalose trehalohydrolase
MFSKGDGWHQLRVSEASAGTQYCFVLPDDTRVPDPASRFQPNDVYGPSEVIDALAYQWKDTTWSGRPWHEGILYELHIGAFTEEGSFLGAIKKLDHLVELGITGIELMAVADFPGTRNWGYDGVLLYAPDSAYGRPEDLKAFVDAAHERELMVIFDVVYNHLGGVGNLLSKYFPQFYSSKHGNPWGKVPNFDGEEREQVREFIIHNAIYWIEEFHGDGLRLDASHSIIDNSPQHILDELATRVRASAGQRIVHLTVEDEHNISARLVRGASGECSGYTAQWNHQMAHLRELPLAKNSGAVVLPDKKIKTVAHMVAFGFEGTSALSEESDGIDSNVTSAASISFLQTHDLVGNDLIGQRIYSKFALEAVRALSALYLLAPQIPMLFMGDEWGASTPFPFFCDFPEEIANDVRRGRLQFLQKDLHADENTLKRVPDPLALATFRSAKLDWDEVRHGVHMDWLEWYRRILHVRQENIIPLLKSVPTQRVSYQVVGPRSFIARWMFSEGSQLAVEANLGDEAAKKFQEQSGEILWKEGAELNPQELGPWTVLWRLVP